MSALWERCRLRSNGPAKTDGAFLDRPPYSTYIARSARRLTPIGMAAAAVSSRSRADGQPFRETRMPVNTPFVKHGAGNSILEKFRSLADIGIEGIEITSSSSVEYADEIRQASAENGVTPNIFSIRGTMGLLDARLTDGGRRRKT